MDTSKLLGEPLGLGMCNGMATWVAVGLGGGIGLGPWGFLPNPCSEEKCIETKDKVYLHNICVCSGVWKGKKEMGIFKPPKGTLKVCRIGS